MPRHIVLSVRAKTFRCIIKIGNSNTFFFSTTKPITFFSTCRFINFKYIFLKIDNDILSEDMCVISKHTFKCIYKFQVDI